MFIIHFKWAWIYLLAVLCSITIINGEDESVKHPEKNEEFGVSLNNVNQENLPNVENVEIKQKEEVKELNTTCNETQTNSTNKKTATCKPKIGGTPVEIANGTQLIKILLSGANVTSKDMPGECTLVLFFAKFCTFSSMAAPHFNALSRAFPDIKMVAIDAMRHHLFNSQNGIVGVPTVLLFHGGRPIAKFNETDYTLELFSKFITKHTGIKPEEKSYVTSADFAGPVPSTPEKETDYFLGLSWLFIIVCGIYYFSKSKWCKKIVETIKNTWRESEAQHEHVD